MSPHPTPVVSSVGCRLILFVLFIGVYQSGAVAREAPLSQPLTVLAITLMESPNYMRTDFARAAISETAGAYVEEANRARGEARQAAQRRDLLRWAAAVNAYAVQLTAIAETITPATRIEVTITAENSVYLRVDGTPVIVGSPRHGRQAEFERRVIERFCAWQSCDELIAEAVLPAPAPVVRRSSATQWSFSQHAGPVCQANDGLEFQFKDMTDLGQKRLVCDQLVGELNTIASAIAGEVAYGTRIDWNRLEIRPLPGGEGHRIDLNGDGSYIHLSLPGLAAATDLFRLVRPWLAAKSKGSSYPLVLINAERLFAPVTIPWQ